MVASPARGVYSTPAWLASISLALADEQRPIPATLALRIIVAAQSHVYYLVTDTASADFGKPDASMAATTLAADIVDLAVAARWANVGRPSSESTVETAAQHLLVSARALGLAQALLRGSSSNASCIIFEDDVPVVRTLAQLAAMDNNTLVVTGGSLGPGRLLFPGMLTLEEALMLAGVPVDDILRWWDAAMAAFVAAFEGGAVVPIDAAAVAAARAAGLAAGAALESPTLRRQLGRMRLLLLCVVDAPPLAIHALKGVMEAARSQSAGTGSTPVWTSLSPPYSHTYSSPQTAPLPVPNFPVTSNS